VISAVSGTAGVGKTALAVHWAHRVRDWFPDGQLYVDLRGYDPDQPMAPGDALARFLTGLGVPGRDIPLDVDERAARYRTEVAGRRMLVVLDNVSTVEQVRPLLPGSATCAVVVTSRDSLSGLVAREGAQRLDLDLLPLTDAVALLRLLIGGRVDAAPDAAAELADLCARLPLALRVAAEFAVARPDTTLADLVKDLADQQRRLDLLNAGGDQRAAVAAVFSWSVRHLSPRVVKLFRLLGIHPGTDFDAYAAAALAGVRLAEAREMLERLHRSHLIEPAGPARFGMHDLLRAYAVQRAELDDVDGCEPALSRLFDYYLATAARAMNALNPAESHLRPQVERPATPVPEIDDPETARTWLDTERSSLVAVAAYTASRDRPEYTVRLSKVLYRYLDAGHPTDALAVHGYAFDAAQLLGDTAGQAHAMLGLGALYLRLGRFWMAVEYLRPALALYRQAGDLIGEARATGNIANAEQRLGRYTAAADHHEQALALFRRNGDSMGEAMALGNLGVIEARLGRYELAVHHLEEALVLNRKAGADNSGEAFALNFLGDAEARLGRHEIAREHLDQALALYRQLHNRDGEAWTLINLGALDLRLDQPGSAADRYRQALALFREVADRDGDSWALNGLGDAALSDGRLSEALVRYTDALTIASDIGTRDQVAHAHAGLGRAHLALGDLERARDHFAQALGEYTELSSPHAEQIRAALAALPGETPDR
jgi:tetratricopeptide (TPR) repeat protein